MGAFSIWHIVVVAIVAAFLFFGWKNLPDMARSFGRSLRVFKTEIKGMTDDDSAREKARDEANAEPKQLAPRPAPAQQAVPRAQVVPPNKTVDARPAAAAAQSRPRPAPSPNGSARR